jgi:hypothetical protein
MNIRRRLAVAAAVAAGIAAVPGTVHADAAGPTDFRTEIVSVTPDTPAVALSIEGGDAFVRLGVEPGTDVTVLGYDDEPYVMIDADGVVWENQRSYATYYNSSRYGTGAIPAEVDNTAAPEWERVGDGGGWAWHDHRAHWMGAEPPLGMEPGDALPEQVIPLIVDGARVEVTVISTLVGGPSWGPTMAGGVLAVLITIAALVFGQQALAVLAWSLGALLVGAIQFLSLPAETGPRPIWWLPPLVAVVCAGAAVAVASRRSPVVHHGLVVLAGAQLLLWAFVRRTTFTRPVLPTEAPFWLDRAASAAAVAGSVLAIGAGVASLARLMRQPARAASIASSSAS